MKLPSLLVSLVLLLQACAIPEKPFKPEELPPTAAGIPTRTHEDIPLPAISLHGAIEQAVVAFSPSVPFDQPTKTASGIPVPALANLETIETEWQPVPGKTTGILIWKKDWQTEVRHRITIFAAVRDPTNTSSYDIVSEVRERPNSSYPWREGSPELAKNSEQELRKAIEIQIKERIDIRAGKI